MRCALLLLASLLAAADPLAEPRLGIETGFHSARINRIDVDRSGAILSVSRDKTARIWRVVGEDLVQEQVFRVPVGEGEAGCLYAGAITDDGTLVAVGGWDVGSGHHAYLFDRRTGALLRRLGPVSNTICHLRFDAAGGALAMGVGSAHGIRVFDVRSGELRWMDVDYNADCLGFTWLADGGLATASADGKVRGYTADGKRRFATDIGPYLSGLACDPTGILLAGRNRTMQLARLRADDGTRLDDLDTAGLKGGSLSSVAWAAGAWWAGGTYGGFDSPVVRWGATGRTESPGPVDSVMDIVANLAAPGVVVAGADPMLLVLDGEGRRIAGRSGAKVDLRSQERFLASSADGRKIRFGLVSMGREPVLFDAAEGSLADAADLPDGLATARLSAPGLDVTAWNSARNPAVNGTAVAMRADEKAESLAIPPNGQLAVVGTNFALHALDAQGAQLWTQSAPGTAWAVVATGDGRSLVVGCGDGTIRWLRLRDGKEYLALFVHAQDRRWVLWTPSGYYQASTGAESLIGWHVNRGVDQAADFFPAGRFRARFHRPDVVAASFDTCDEAQALAQVGAKAAPALAGVLPPVVAIADPADGSAATAATVAVRYRVRSPSGKPLTAVRVLVDGVEVEAVTERGLKRVVAADADGDEAVVRVPIPPRDCTVGIIAATADGSSEPAQVRLRWTGASAAAAADLPALYILGLGVSDYRRDELDLAFAAKDVADIADAFAAQRGRLYRTVTAQVVRNPTKEEMLDGFDWLARQCTNRDLAVIAIAGHGEVDAKGTYYLLPSDADPQRLRATALPHSDIVRAIQDLPCKKLAFLDTCHAGAAQGGARRRGAADAAELVNTLADPDTGCVMFCAATGRQPSQEHDRWGNGAFSKAVVEALTGRADGVSDPVLTAILAADRLTHARLNTYVAERVKQLTGGQQTPTYAAPSTVPDFPVALRR